MSSGVVEYKLCDLNFDCDRCSFDKALWHRTTTSEPSPAPPREDEGIVKKLQDTIREDDKRNDILLLPNQLMVRKLYKNTYFVGITRFLGECLEPLNTVTIDIEKGLIKAGSPAIHIRKDSRNWQLCFPFDIYVLANMAGKKDTGNSRGWIGMFEAEEEEVEEAAITGRTFLDRSRKQLETLTTKLYRHDVGVTMQDGGNLVGSLSELLGDEMFNRFIREITDTNS